MCKSLWQFLFAGNLGLCPSISLQFPLLQPKIAKKSLKINVFEVQGHSRSLMLTFLRSSLSVLVMICSMAVPICNYLHARQAFRRVPSLTPASLNLEGPNLGLLKSTFHAENFLRTLSWSISSHFGAIHS